MDIYYIRAALFSLLARRLEYEIFAVLMADIEKALALRTYTDPSIKVPAEYTDLLPVFDRQEADKLPERRSYDYKIELKDNQQLSYGPLYNMSQNELKVLRKYLEENLGKGFIRVSFLPAALLVIFVKKLGGGL
jgi:hypothetical protein